MHARTEQLHQIMRDHGLNAEAVASILNREPITVYIWRVENTKRVIPEDALRLLEAKAPEVARARQESKASEAIA